MLSRERWARCHRCVCSGSSLVRPESDEPLLARGRGDAGALGRGGMWAEKGGSISAVSVNGAPTKPYFYRSHNVGKGCRIFSPLAKAEGTGHTGLSRGWQGLSWGDPHCCESAGPCGRSIPVPVPARAGSCVLGSP